MDRRSSEVHRKDIKHGCTKSLVNKEAKEKRCMTERKTVNDRSTSVSCWDLPMMCKYIDFRRDVSRWLPNIEKDWSTDKKISIKSLENYNSGISRITGDQSTGSMTEAEVKHIVFVMICPLMEQLDLRMNAEETIDMACMPSCRLDYVLKSGDIPVGAVEVKCKNSFDKKAFAQAVIQLLVLQQWAYKKGLPYRVDMTQIPIVNILTDGERFVFMKLKGEKIYVQKTKPLGLSLHQELVVLHISKNFGHVYEQLQDALSSAVSELRQLLDSSELDADDRQRGASVQRRNKYPHEISIDPVSNENVWRGFLSPLRVGKDEEKRKKRHAPVGGIEYDTIEGPPSLSRTFATKLGDVYCFKPTRVSEVVIQSQKKRRKREYPQRLLKLGEDESGTKSKLTKKRGSSTVRPIMPVTKEPFSS